MGRKQFTQEDFISKAIAIHGNKYDYSKAIYTTSQSYVLITCKIHEYDFEIIPNNHLRGKGCSRCAGNTKKSTEQFIEEANSVHSGYYDYSKTIYKKRNIHVIITCPVHGDFLQLPMSHINQRCGCPDCGGSKIGSTESFITRSNKIHNYCYDYTKTQYVNANTKVVITCKKHGDFLQRAHNHLKGRGCAACVISNAETDIVNVLHTLGMKTIREFRFHDCKDKRPLPFDFYCADLNLCIEYDGEQHYKPWRLKDTEGAINKLILTQLHDKIKTDYCKEKGIRLLRIPYWEKDNIETILSSTVMNIMKQHTS